MFDIRDHGGSYGGVKSRDMISLYDLTDTNIAFVKIAILGDGLIFSQKPMSGGRIFSVDGAHSGNIYWVRILTKEGVPVATCGLTTVSGEISQSYPLSMVCTLPDGSHIFSHMGDIYKLSSNFKTIDRVLARHAYGTGSYENVVLMYISKSTGQLVVINSMGYVYFLNVDTFALIGTGINSPIDRVSSFAHSQIIETNDAYIFKSGDTLGKMHKYTKYAQQTQNPLIFEGYQHHNNGSTWDGTHVYTSANDGIRKYDAQTMLLVKTYALDLSPYTQGMHYDKLGKRLLIFGSAQADAFELKTEKLLGPKATPPMSSFLIYGFDDPDNQRMFMRGDFFLSATRINK